MRTDNINPLCIGLFNKLDGTSPRIGQRFHDIDGQRGALRRCADRNSTSHRTRDTDPRENFKTNVCGVYANSYLLHSLVTSDVILPHQTKVIMGSAKLLRCPEKIAVNRPAGVQCLSAEVTSRRTSARVSCCANRPATDPQWPRQEVSLRLPQKESSCPAP